jgi:hypothetical protein
LFSVVCPKKLFEKSSGFRVTVHVGGTSITKLGSPSESVPHPRGVRGSGVEALERRGGRERARGEQAGKQKERRRVATEQAGEQKKRSRGERARNLR